MFYSFGYKNRNVVRTRLGSSIQRPEGWNKGNFGRFTDNSHDMQSIWILPEITYNNKFTELFYIVVSIRGECLFVERKITLLRFIKKLPVFIRSISKFRMWIWYHRLRDFAHSGCSDLFSKYSVHRWYIVFTSRPNV